MADKDDNHEQRVRTLGLDGGGANDDGDEELARVFAESQEFEEMFKQLETRLTDLLGRVKDCEETEKFLRGAIRAAEENELQDCVQRTDEWLGKQKKARAKSVQCHEKLQAMLPTLSKGRLTRVQRFLQSQLATPTTRGAIETEIVIA